MGVGGPSGPVPTRQDTTVPFINEQPHWVIKRLQLASPSVERGISHTVLVNKGSWGWLRETISPVDTGLTLGGVDHTHEFVGTNYKLWLTTRSWNPKDPNLIVEI